VTDRRRILFVCSRNKWRSPTAEVVLAAREDLEVRSAGFNKDSESVLAEDDIDWADTILVMERAHLKRIRKLFSDALEGRKLASLDIPDRYQYMDPELIEIIERKAAVHLPVVPDTD